MTTSFGKDISCTTELRTGRYSAGARLVAESIFRRLTTPRGMLRGGEAEANFGLDLTELVGSVANAADAASLPGRIASEVRKDERVESVNVIVTNTSTGVARSFAVRIEGTTADGPFTLNVSVDEVTIERLGIQVTP